MLTARMQTAAEGGRSLKDERTRHSEDGFSLIELLVVCLVIAILCAIAIPQFLSQGAKAKDAAAKELLHSAQIAAETIATENDGSYESVSTTELRRVEPTIAIEKSTSHSYLLEATSSKTSYSLTAKSTDGDELTLSKSSSGVTSRTCKSASNGCSGTSAGSW